MKKVLIVTYSQSGQLNEIVDNIIQALQKDSLVHIYYEKLLPDPEFPFPWTDISFWDAMPESVKMIPANIRPVAFNPSEKYDLIILGYPIWFLSPPVPLTTFLKSEKARKVMKDTPVVTVIGARNMWVSAQEEIKKMILENGGKLAGNIALHDRNQNLLSVVTIIYWMMTAKKDRYLGIFPKPGISDKDILNARQFGKPVHEALMSNNYTDLQQKLIDLGATDLSFDVVAAETRAKKIFHVWAGFIRKKGGPGARERIGRLKMFKWYLLFVIFAVSPLASLVFYLTYPLFFIKIRKNLTYYKGVALR